MQPGIIGAKNNGLGAIGVLPGVRIWAANIDRGKHGQWTSVPYKSTAATPTSYAGVEALRWIAANCTVEKYAVVNMSWGLDPTYCKTNAQWCKDVTDLMCQSMRDAVKKCGTVFVSATGELQRVGGWMRGSSSLLLLLRWYKNHTFALAPLDH